MSLLRALRLDTATRAQFRAHVFECVSAQRIPTLPVTHDAADCPPDGRLLRWPGAAGDASANDAGPDDPGPNDA